MILEMAQLQRQRSVMGGARVKGKGRKGLYKGQHGVSFGAGTGICTCGKNPVELYRETFF